MVSSLALAVPLQEAKDLSMSITCYMIHITESEKMSESIDIDEEKEEMCCPDIPEQKDGDKVKCVVKMRCPEGEDAEKIKEKVLMRLGKELGGRSNVVMTRLNDEDLKKIDALVEVEAFKSRSEATAFFIKEGVKARKDLFQKVMPTVEKIKQLKEQAKKSLSQEKPQ